MPDRPDETDWSEIEGQLEPVDPDGTQLPTSPGLPPSTELEDHPIIKRFGGPSGVVMEFRAGRVQRTVALDALRAWYNGQLAVAEAQVHEAVRVQTAQAKAQSEKFLARIDNDYLTYLGELGLRNIDKRQQMLLQLNDQTSENLKQVMNADWPKSMKDQAVAQIRDMHERFAHKLSKELGELPDGDRHR